MAIEKRIAKSATQVATSGELASCGASSLMSLNDHYLDYSAPLQMARAVREQVDWHEVTQRTADSPYARAFVALLAELEIVTPRDAPAQRPNVRVVPG